MKIGRVTLMGRTMGLALGILVCAQAAFAVEPVDLSHAVIVTRPGDLPHAESAAAMVLAEEIALRTGLHLATSTEWPKDGPVIAITSQASVPSWGRAIPVREGKDLPETRAEGFRLFVEADAARPAVVWVVGADGRGALYGVGALLRHLNWSQGKAALPGDLDLATAPAYPIRGHQLGYRVQANSWDAWTPEQFDRYIRELAFFGINSVENIPFQDDRTSPLMKVERREMNRRMSEICGRYGLDYWVWTPADFDLKDNEARAKALDKHEQLYKDCKELTGVFFPGGDPGDNPPELVLPFLEDVSKRLLPLHPNARVWVSLQGFTKDQIEYVADYLKRESPDWLAGLAGGPSSPPIPYTRSILPKKYKYRLYPDITHNKISQYPVQWWDAAFSMTLGREAINPRPVQYAYIHNWFAPYSDGFISYSDGVHDDVNKTIWSALSWNPDAGVRDILVEYCREFFSPSVAEDAADGILALERNWHGPLRENGALEGTLLLWQRLEHEMPGLAENWRWQMCLVRAYYDAYIHRRLLNETRLEDEANTVMLGCATTGADEAMTQAMAVLNRAVDVPVSPELRARIFDLCEKLFQSIGLQTSVEKYSASGAERGAFLDFVDVPLNNRWWLEDEFKKVREMSSEEAERSRLVEIATWAHPPFGSYYDDIGDPANSPHVKRSEIVYTEVGEEAHPEPLQWWLDNGKSRERISWQSTMDYPEAVVYEGLDPDASYTVRCTGYGTILLRIDGELVEPPAEHVAIGEPRDFPVPAKCVEDRKAVLTWDHPPGEEALNWRQRSRLSEVWLLRK